MGGFFSLEKPKEEEKEELQGLKEEVESVVRSVRDGRSYLEVVKSPHVPRPAARRRTDSIRQVLPSSTRRRSFRFTKE